MMLIIIITTVTIIFITKETYLKYILSNATP